MLGMVATDRFKSLRLDQAKPGTAVFVYNDEDSLFLIGTTEQEDASIFLTGSHKLKVIPSRSLQSVPALSVDDLRFEVDFNTASQRPSFGALLYMAGAVAMVGKSWNGNERHTIRLQGTPVQSNESPFVYFTRWRVGVLGADQCLIPIYSGEPASKPDGEQSADQ